MRQGLEYALKSPQKLDAQDCEDNHPEGIYQVILNLTGLQAAEAITELGDRIRQPVDESVDDALVDFAALHRQVDRDAASGIHDRVDDVAIRPAQEARERHERGDEHCTIELVD